MKTWLTTGRLRCAINLGNPLLAQPDGDSAKGVSVDMATQLADTLGVECQWLVVNNAREAVQALEEERADLGFLAVDPSRAQHIAFTAAYLLIEGCYLVREDSPLTHHADVDQRGRTVVVGLGSAYDLYLSRHLQHATLIKAASSKDVVNTWMQNGHDVAAGVKQQLENDMQHHPGLRLLPEAFMTIEQAMAVPKSRGAEALRHVEDLLQGLKHSGFIREAMQRHGVSGARLAP